MNESITPSQRKGRKSTKSHLGALRTVSNRKRSGSRRNKHWPLVPSRQSDRQLAPWKRTPYAGDKGHKPPRQPLDLFRPVKQRVQS